MVERTTPRGRAAVEAALVEAAADLLAEQGSRGVRLRAVADRAGVNKGQIHHYFGGKQALLEAAFRHLAAEHFARARARSGDAIPLPLTLGLDTRYVQALTRLILDGELDLVRLEFREGISVPRAVLEVLDRRTDRGDSRLERRTSMAAAMAIEMGWAVFAPFILEAVQADDQADVDTIVAEVARRARRGAR